MASRAGKTIISPRAGKTNNQPVLPVVAINPKKTGAACCGHTKKNPTKQNNNHPVWRPPIMTHGRKQEKAQSSCAAAWHGCKQEKNNQTVQPLAAASKKKRTINLCGLSRLREKEKKNNQPVSRVASLCEWGKTTISNRKQQQSTCARGLKHMQQQKNTQTTTINKCGLSWPQQEEKQTNNLTLTSMKGIDSCCCPLLSMLCKISLFWCRGSLSLLILYTWWW